MIRLARNETIKISQLPKLVWDGKWKPAVTCQHFSFNCKSNSDSKFEESAISTGISSTLLRFDFMNLIYRYELCINIKAALFPYNNQQVFYDPLNMNIQFLNFLSS